MKKYIVFFCYLNCRDKAGKGSSRVIEAKNPQQAVRYAYGYNDSGYDITVYDVAEYLPNEVWQ